jgi:hypothetical protein
VEEVDGLMVLISSKLRTFFALSSNLAIPLALLNNICNLCYVAFANLITLKNEENFRLWFNQILSISVNSFLPFGQCPSEQRDLQKSRVFFDQLHPKRGL